MPCPTVNKGRCVKTGSCAVKPVPPQPQHLRSRQAAHVAASDLAAVRAIVGRGRSRLGGVADNEQLAPFGVALVVGRVAFTRALRVLIAERGLGLP